MNRLVLIIILLSCWIPALGQGSHEADSIIKDAHQLYYSEEWRFILLKDTLHAKIVDHIPASIICGVSASASVSIVLTNNGDLIRIIDMCNTSDKFYPGQQIKILPNEKPPFGLDLPSTLRFNGITKKIEPSVYNHTVITTTWGHLLQKK